MSVASRPRSAPFSEDHNWPRHKPVFSLLTLLFALLCGVGIFAYRFKTAWTPLQQYYLRDYFRTAQVSSSPNSFCARQARIGYSRSCTQTGPGWLSTTKLSSSLYSLEPARKALLHSVPGGPPGVRAAPGVADAEAG